MQEDHQHWRVTSGLWRHKNRMSQGNYSCTVVSWVGSELCNAACSIEKHFFFSSNVSQLLSKAYQSTLRIQQVHKNALTLIIIPSARGYWNENPGIEYQASFGSKPNQEFLSFKCEHAAAESKFQSVPYIEVLFGYLLDVFSWVKTSHFNRNLQNLEFCVRVKDFTALYRTDQQKAT